MKLDKGRVGTLFGELGGGGGGAEALGELYDLCARTIYGYAFAHLRNREDSEDVVQEVFVKLMKTRSALKEVRNPAAYLLCMTHRAMIDMKRKSSGNELQVEIVDAREEKHLTVAEKTALNQALCSLPPEQRAAVYLKEVEGLSLREIAAVTGTNIFTAASRCRLGLGRLKKLLEV